MLVVLLFLTLVVEIGSDMGYFSWNKSNNWIFNILTAIEFIVFTTVFYRITVSKQKKNIMLIMLIILITWVMINVSFVQGMRKFHTYSFLPGALLMIACAIFYYRQMLDNLNISIASNVYFWFSTGILVFYAIQFSVMSYFTYIYDKGDGFLSFWNFFSTMSNIVEYSCFSILFIISIKQRKIT